jgi:flavin-dependent dehydrogenase
MSHATALPSIGSAGETPSSAGVTLAELDTPKCEATIDCRAAATVEWQVLVIGAGPAGAIAARQLSAAGLRTLLVDKSPFPRPKVCGGCISARGLRLLNEIGLGRLVSYPHAVPLLRFDLAARNCRGSFDLPGGATVSRSHFDAVLVREAIDCGANFLPETSAEVRGATEESRTRLVGLQGPSRRIERVKSRMVLVADGLGRTSVRHRRFFAPQIAKDSRVGLGAILPREHAEVPAGVIEMFVGKQGYVGMVRLPDDRINIAAAVDPVGLREGGSARVINTILAEAGRTAGLDLDQADWRGTGLLTRRRQRVAGKRLLFLGDAAGYVEPFTGEGMTWAMLSAASIASLVVTWVRREESADRRLPTASRGAMRTLATEWGHLNARLVSRRQRNCRMLAWALRHPWLTECGLRFSSRFPRLAAPLIDQFWKD